jgi:hypothetical protein
MLEALWGPLYQRSVKVFQERGLRGNLNVENPGLYSGPLRGVPRRDHPPWCEGVLGREYEITLRQKDPRCYTRGPSSEMSWRGSRCSIPWAGDPILIPSSKKNTIIEPTVSFRGLCHTTREISGECRDVCSLHRQDFRKLQVSKELHRHLSRKRFLAVKGSEGVQAKIVVKPLSGCMSKSYFPSDRANSSNQKSAGCRSMEIFHGDMNSPFHDEPDFPNRVISGGWKNSDEHRHSSSYSQWSQSIPPQLSVKHFCSITSKQIYHHTLCSLYFRPNATLIVTFLGRECKV